jgi:hypothetical protein
MKYLFDGSSVLPIGAPEMSEEIIAILGEAYPDPLLTPMQAALDPWRRGVIELSEDQATRMQKAVEKWNDDMGDETGYNPYPISFSPATGAEHLIPSTGKYTAKSWQW